jgi:hypothetical protein
MVFLSDELFSVIELNTVNNIMTRQSHFNNILVPTMKSIILYGFHIR